MVYSQSTEPIDGTTESKERFVGLKDEGTLSDSDLKRCRDLWQWGQRRLLTRPNLKMSRSASLTDMGQQQEHDQQNGVDITAMVASLPIETPAETVPGACDPCGYLRLWDGTGGNYCDP